MGVKRVFSFFEKDKHYPGSETNEVIVLPQEVLVTSLRRVSHTVMCTIYLGMWEPGERGRALSHRNVILNITSMAMIKTMGLVDLEKKGLKKT